MVLPASQLYDSSPVGKFLAQGDVLDGLPFVYTPPKHRRWVLLRPLPKEPIDRPIGGLPRNFKAFLDGELLTAWDRPDGELIMAAGYSGLCMILSQSCDLDFRKNVQIAPVMAATEIQNEKTLENLRSGNIGYYYYLPPTADLAESFADFTHITSIDPSYIRIDHVKARLSDRGNLDFMIALSDYFAKPFGWNTRDSVLQAGNYRCAHCFYTAAALVQESIEAGSNFPACKQCGDQVLWVKVP
jgi:hypothetical protein